MPSKEEPEGKQQMEIMSRAKKPQSLEVLRARAKKEIGEVDSEIQDKIHQLLRLVEDANLCLPSSPGFFDSFYLRCIRARKYDMKNAAIVLKKYCHLRIDGASDLLGKMMPSEFTEIFRNKFISALRTRDPEGRKIFFVRAEKWDPRETSFENICMSMFLFIDELVSNEDTQLFGLKMIVDLRSWGFDHVRAIRPKRIHLIVKIIQDSYPARFKEFHIINNPALFGIIWNTAKPFFKEKLRQRIFLHGDNLAGLQSALGMDPKFLPHFCGGKLSEEDYDESKIWKNLITRDSYYTEMLKYGHKHKPSSYEE